MGTFSIWHWLVVLLVVLLLFGGGKISGLMGDLAKGIKAFKSGLKEDEKEQAEAAKPAGSLAAPDAPAAQQAQAQAQPQAAQPQPQAQRQG
ncbi:MAG: twin-arginine translocase TatA/TatE family subunit [Alphaproteobacteria bacterium]|nr:twin-arginine translocase TatA/TatE family subunit [Alphaproteobacteria bacterium]